MAEGGGRREAGRRGGWGDRDQNTGAKHARRVLSLGAVHAWEEDFRDFFCMARSYIALGLEAAALGVDVERYHAVLCAVEHDEKEYSIRSLDVFYLRSSQIFRCIPPSFS